MADDEKGPQGPPPGPPQAQTLDAIALQLTALSHAVAGLQGQIQGLLVLVQLELRARAGGAPALAMPAGPGTVVSAGNKGSLLGQLERELTAAQRGSGATFMGRPRPDAAPPVDVPAAHDAPPTTTGRDE